VTKLVAYLAHPVSAPTPEGIAANLANARAWLKWLVDNTPWAISCPWIPYVESLAEESYRERGLADDLAMLGRGHDLVVLVGGRVSTGMAMERDHAASRMPVVDLTPIGVAPPTGDAWAEQRAMDTIAWVAGELIARRRLAEAAK
jgi:hypothetical protein